MIVLPSSAAGGAIWGMAAPEIEISHRGGEGLLARDEARIAETAERLLPAFQAIGRRAAAGERGPQAFGVAEDTADG